jgi:hypothetical protein
MKSKKIKKLAKLIYQEMSTHKEVYEPISKSKDSDTYLHEADQETSDKFFNFMCNLLKLQGRLNINISSDYITISGDLDQFITTNSPGGTTLNHHTIKASNELEAHVSRDGFFLSRGWSSRAKYKDNKIFDRLLPIALERQKEINKEVISDLIDDIMVITKLSRENNLEELLS